MRVIVVVHGIGSHSADELLDSVRAGMPDDEEADTDLLAFDWSAIPGVVGGPTLSLDTIRRMTAGLAAAARLGTVRQPAAVLAEALWGVAMILPVLGPALTGLLLLALNRNVWSVVRLELVAMGWIAAAAAACALMVLARSGISALRRRDTAPLAEWGRWVTLVVLRPIVLVSLLPFAPFLWEFFTLGGESAKALTWVSVTGLFVAAFGWLWGEPWAVMGNIALAAIVVAGLCIAWFAGQLVYMVFGPTLKALLDVFLFVGDYTHRETLRSEFDRFVARLPPSDGNTRQVTICAHSLGTLIALDSLLHSSRWTRDDEVKLVTCGSPLRRLVLRFFPGVVFPRTVEEIATTAASRVRSLQWTNFSRPFDYVGGSLGLARHAVGRDIRSGSLLKSHSGYFADPELWAAVAIDTPPVPADAVAVATGTWITDADDRVRPFQQISNLVAKSGYVLAPAAALLFIAVTVSQGGRPGRDPAAAARAALRAPTAAAAATVTHWRVSIPGDPPDEVDHFSFEWGGGPAHEITVAQGEVVFTGYQTLFDVGRLQDAVRADCDLLGARAPLQRSIRVACRTRHPIQVRYATAQPEYFDIPAFPPRSSPLRRGFDWFRVMWVGIGWCLIGVGLNTWVAGAWGTLLFGLGVHEPARTPRPAGVA